MLGIVSFSDIGWSHLSSAVQMSTESRGTAAILSKSPGVRTKSARAIQFRARLSMVFLIKPLSVRGSLLPPF